MALPVAVQPSYRERQFQVRPAEGGPTAYERAQRKADIPVWPADAPINSSAWPPLRVGVGHHLSFIGAIMMRWPFRKQRLAYSPARC